VGLTQSSCADDARCYFCIAPRPPIGSAAHRSFREKLALLQTVSPLAVHGNPAVGTRLVPRPPTSCPTDVSVDGRARCGHTLAEKRLCNRARSGEQHWVMRGAVTIDYQSDGTIAIRRQGMRRTLGPCKGAKELVPVARVVDGIYKTLRPAQYHKRPCQRSLLFIRAALCPLRCVQAPPKHARIIPRPRPRSRGT
jgi:hypothetical protein